MYRDFRDLLKILNDHGVAYLIVGGYALAFHSEPRSTGDLDLFVGDDPHNARALFEALTDFGAPLEGLAPLDLTNGFFRMGRKPVMVDISTRIDGVAFEAAWSRRVRSVIDPESGLAVTVLAREDLIANKIAAGRPRDLADLATLTGETEDDEA